jgi:hypothetical protein
MLEKSVKDEEEQKKTKDNKRNDKYIEWNT